MLKRLKKLDKNQKRPCFETIALLLQGGGSLGAYQGGVYQALAEANIYPDWVSGASIGAINAAIIVGNPPDKRVQKLRDFWEYITTKYIPGDLDIVFPNLSKGDIARSYLNNMSSTFTASCGVNGFFSPWPVSPWFQQLGTTEARSYYNPVELKETLMRFIDFNLINSGKIRLSMCAVNIRSGNSVYFDTKKHTISPEHIMASAALPPGFPPVEIEGEYYWDGGLISNTPLQWVLDGAHCEDTLIFQVDLWSARGKLPRNMPEVMTRLKEIQYSSRTRSNTDRFKSIQKMRYSIANFLDTIPDDLKNTPEAEFLKKISIRKIYNIIHLIYRPQNYEGRSKDYEFSRLSMEDHWNAGYFDTIHTLRHPEILERHVNNEPVLIYDFTRDGDDY